MMNHYYQQASFVQSATTPKTLPKESGLEVAFAGRSNSGKSSTINRVCSQKSLARTSKTPGRTQLINFFTLPEGQLLVDLPGYGYAKVPENLKIQWQKFIEAYLTMRTTLKGLILVMDIRHPMTMFDQGLLAWAAHRQLPVHILLNKADKLSRGAMQNTVLAVRKELITYQSPVTVQAFSASSGLGLEELWEKLNEWFERGAKKIEVSIH
ncbi:ribosome biogenesis GTP-binding protein YihA/YsxC [uncultured Thiothrix sp.]|uniref:ribosome biogenesis GTP-binding protein YihA/YsxC n=1 Tax=uncultured Thiothrix sp. TaxID=223185 RepID=UPI0026353693|nr:ribosome biogenesis GTP-binding protein YihA/YsxC [uncultured Thiothrix sp.]